MIKNNKLLFLNKKSLSQCIVGIIFVLALLVISYHLLLYFYPKIFRDDFGVPIGDVKLQIYNAQEDYYRKHGYYKKDFLEIVKIPENSKVGWRDSFPEIIKNECPECFYSKDSYGLIYLEEKNGYVFLWKISNQNRVELLSRFNSWRFD